MAFKFIHMADVHLDTPFLSRDEALRKTLKESLMQSFKSCIDLAIEEKVDAILIAGDLLDGETASYRSEKLLLEQAERLKAAGITMFYSPGNHDPEGSLVRAGRTIYPNIHVFGSERSETISVPGKDGAVAAVITGMGHGSLREGRNLADHFPQAEHGVPSIALLHTFVAGSAAVKSHDRYAPCTLSDLENKGYSYWALGHIHAREELLKEPYVIYPGNLMGRNPGETGQKGVYLVEIDGTNSVRYEFKPLSPICWETVTFGSLMNIDSLLKLENLICSEISMKSGSRSPNSRMLYRVVLEGPCPICTRLLDEEDVRELEESIESALGALYVEIITDGITRPVNIESYREGPHVLSTVLSLIDNVKDDDELLLRLVPDNLAGLKPSADKQEKIEYLRSLLPNIDNEAVSYLIKE